MESKDHKWRKILTNDERTISNKGHGSPGRASANCSTQDVYFIKISVPENSITRSSDVSKGLLQ